MDGLGIADLVIFNDRSGLHLFRCQVFAVLTLFSLVGFGCCPVRGKSPITLLNSIAMPPQAPRHK